MKDQRKQRKIALAVRTTILQSTARFSNMRPRDMWFYESPDKYVREFLICDYEYLIAKICTSREKLYVRRKLR